MGRRALQPGEAGEIATTPLRRNATGGYETLPPRSRGTHHRARVTFRDWSGKRRDLSRIAPSKAQAVEDVKQALREALATGDGVLTGQTPVVNACRQWLDDVSKPGGKLSAGSVRAYENAYKLAIAAHGSPIAGLTLLQVNDAQVLSRFLVWVAEERGAGTAKQAKAVLSNVLKRAVSYRVLPSNELRQVVGGIPKVPAKRGANRDKSRALTEGERAAVLTLADERCDPEAVIARTLGKRRAAADLMHFMAGTGVRIGEALAMRWEHIDRDTGRCEVRGTKTAGSDRVLTLPSWLVERLNVRAELTGRVGYVFPAPAGGDPERLWDQSNASGELRAILDAAGLEWATPHSFRRSVATRLHAQGVGVNRVADVLGHKDASMTARVYLGRDLQGDKADLAALL